MAAEVGDRRMKMSVDLFSKGQEETEEIIHIFPKRGRSLVQW